MLLSVASRSLRRAPALRSRSLVTTVSRAQRDTAPRRLSRRLARMWVYAMGKGRRAPLLTAQQSRIIGNSSFIFVSLSFLSTDMMNLRLLNIASGALMFVYNIGATQQPLRIGMRWGMLLMLINLLQVRKLTLEQREGILPPREAQVYANFFAHGRLLSETAFLALASEGEWQTLHRGSHIIEQGCSNEWAYLLLDGAFRVHRRAENGTPSREVAVLGRGSWIGERGFLRQFVLPAFVDRDNGTAPSFATVTVQSDTARILRWRRSDLKSMMEKSQGVNVGILLAMLRDVVHWDDHSELSLEESASPVQALLRSPEESDVNVGHGLLRAARVVRSIWRRPDAVGGPSEEDVNRLRHFEHGLSRARREHH